MYNVYTGKYYSNVLSGISLFFYSQPNDFYVPEDLEEVLTEYYKAVNPEKVDGVYPSWYSIFFRSTK